MKGLAVETLFDVEDRSERDAFLRRVEALIAPIAANSGAVVTDLEAVEVARAVFAAFGSPEAAGGLTRAQIAAACAGVCDEATFSSRFDLFCRLDMLEPVYEKAHQQRYVFNPTSAAGLMVLDRLAVNGGVDELMMLLDRTRGELEAGRANREQVRAQMRQALMMMTISTDHLRRMVSSSPLSELIAQRRHHNHGSLMENVFALDREVRERFPELDHDALLLVRQTQQYVGARDDFVGRLLAEGAASKDFSMLDPEEYVEAAFTASVEDLAAVFAPVVFDRPSPWLDPATVAERVVGFVPRPTLRQRPPRPPQSEGPDPMAAVEERVAREQARRVRTVDLHMQGEAEVDLTSRLRAAGWPGAARLLVDLLAVHADPDLPVRLVVGKDLIVDPDGPVTFVSPVGLERVEVSEAVAVEAAAYEEDGVGVVVDA